LLQGDKELVGTLLGIDEFVNMVMSDVTEIEENEDGSKKENKLQQILLNGSNVAMIVPESQSN